MKSVAIQGQKGSFHDQAAKEFFGNSVAITPCETFKEVFTAVGGGKTEGGIVAIENSLYGSINPVYDLLLKTGCKVVGEVYLRIEHCLIGLDNADIGKITEVHSQLEALAQCEDYLDTNLPNAKRVEEHDTAASVEMVKEWGDPTKAAIASKRAADEYGMSILAKNVETNSANYTRFVVISKNGHETTAANKTSLVLTTKADTKPGALFKALGAFAKRDINLTMLQSRPLIGKAWHYLFYVDLEVSANSPEFEQTTKELEDLGFEVTLLGSYKAGMAS